MLKDHAILSSSAASWKSSFVWLCALLRKSNSSSFNPPEGPAALPHPQNSSKPLLEAPWEALPGQCRWQRWGPAARWHGAVPGSGAWRPPQPAGRLFTRGGRNEEAGTWLDPFPRREPRRSPADPRQGGVRRVPGWRRPFVPLRLVPLRLALRAEGLPAHAGVAPNNSGAVGDGLIPREVKRGVPGAARSSGTRCPCEPLEESQV